MEIVMSPEVFVDGIAKAMPGLTRDEQIRLLDHCWVWAVVSYENDIPEDVARRLNELDERCLF